MKRSDNRIRDLLVAYRMRKSPETQFSIYTNEQIEALIEAKPKTLEELSNIKGFPKSGNRVKNYGEDIINIIQGEDIQEEKEDVEAAVSVAGKNKNSVSADVPVMNNFSK